jgi:putative holliday junction resolvase
LKKENVGRIAGIDWGSARIGIAISDTTQFIASPVKAVATKPTPKETAMSLLQELASFEPIDTIVLGLPLMMNGNESESSQKVRALGAILEELCGKKVVFWDERLTTAQVERTLKEAQMGRKKRVKYVDAMAASAILQSYLDRLSIGTPI